MIDLEVIKKNCGGDPETVVEIAQIFLSEYPQHVTAIERALREKRGDDLQFAAHRLRGDWVSLARQAAADAAEVVELLGARQQLESAALAVGILMGELFLIGKDVSSLVAHINT